MISQYNTSVRKPHRLKSNKDEGYHLEYGKWCMKGFFHSLHTKFLSNSAINWAFIKGNQWIFKEDMESFLLDDNSLSRHRIQLTRNVVRPIFNHLRGQSVYMDYNANARLISDKVVNRREEHMNKIMFMDGMSRAFPDFEDALKKNYNIGKTPGDTREEAELTFADKYAEDINLTIDHVRKEIDIDNHKYRGSEQLTATGLVVSKTKHHTDKYDNDVIDSMFFVFDRGALRPDLTDSEFMGDWSYMAIPTLLEDYEGLSAKNRVELENQAVQNVDMIYQAYGVYGNKSRVPVMRMYWRDSERQEFAYVIDPFGYTIFTRINHETSIYRTKDAIPKSQLKDDFQKNRVKKNGVATRYMEVTRYCHFVPQGFVGYNGPDVILKHGIFENQPHSLMYPSKSKFPYQCETYMYDKGEILSPIDDAIDPQRFINRVMSINESQLNSSHNGGLVIAADAIDERYQSYEEVVSASKKGNPIVANIDKTGGVGNSIGRYHSNVGDAAGNMIAIMQDVKLAMDASTGASEASMGNASTPHALVGVLQNQIHQGNIMQQPFYYSLGRWMKQKYEDIATTGILIMSRNEVSFTAIGGDRMLKRVQMSKDMALEDLRIFLETEENDVSAQEKANQLLINLKMLGMIDDKLFAELWNNADAHKIADEMLRYQKIKAIAMREKEEEDQKILAAQMQKEEIDKESMIARADSQFEESMQQKDKDRISKELQNESRNKTSIKRDSMRLN